MSTCEKREELVNKKVEMSEKKYQREIGRSYHIGFINAALWCGKTYAEIAEKLGMKESQIRDFDERRHRAQFKD